MATPDDLDPGAPAAFPETRGSMIARARDAESPERALALGELCRLYWKPIYAYVRSARAASAEDAQDATQDFVIDLLEGGLLARYRPDRGSFRAYLRGALRLFLLERHRARQAARRGGGRRILSIDAAEALRVEDLAVRGATNPDEAFERQWMCSLLDLAIADLRGELEAAGKGVRFEVFRRYELDLPPEGAPTYARIASDLGISTTDVGNHLTACRRRLRERVIERIRDYAGSEAEVAEELFRHLG